MSPAEPTRDDVQTPAPDNGDGAAEYGFPAALWRALERHRPPGLGRTRAWRSPLRGPWLTSVFAAVLLVGLPVVILTGLLDYIAYGPQFGQSMPGEVGWLRLPGFDWPTRPAGLYRISQGLHVTTGIASIRRSANALTGEPSPLSAMNHLPSTPLSVPVIWP